MVEFLYERRFTFFLVSFLVTLFGNILIPEELHDGLETVLIMQNMVFSWILFHRQSNKQKGLVALLIVLAFFTRINHILGSESNGFFFAAIYFVHFAMICYRLGLDLSRQKVVGVETIAAVFCGFLLIGVMASIVFISIDKPLGAFGGSINNRDFSDFLYFSFVTLLTIGYGDITPIIEISRKLVVLVGLLGHFYTVFVTAIIIGKYLNTK